MTYFLVVELENRDRRGYNVCKTAVDSVEGRMDALSGGMCPAREGCCEENMGRTNFEKK